MLVIGIDPGTAATGYGLVREADDGSLQAIEHGVIVTSADLPMQDRLAKLYNELQDLLVLHQPDYSAVEKLFFQRNVRTAISVGQARGVVMLTLAQAQVNVAEYAPVEIKQAVAGYGGADKRQVSLMVSKLLNLEEVPKPDDAADALAIAICHCHSARMRQIAEES
jgi:crossover junction endodeoxyribonuclease RuvC